MIVFVTVDWYNKHCKDCMNCFSVDTPVPFGYQIEVGNAMVCVDCEDNLEVKDKL